MYISAIRKILVLSLIFISGNICAQLVRISGKIIDESGHSLKGALIRIDDNDNYAISNNQGLFFLSISDSTGQNIKVSHVAYQDFYFNIKEISGEFDIGTIKLLPSVIGLKEITVLSSMGEKTSPIALSKINSQDIIAKSGSQEFPELLKSVPGVYTSKQGGGFGDARISVRGFNSDNVGVIINNVPVNGIQNGKLYWSNWAGIAEIAHKVEVQRGMGMSMLTVPSVGGTINIISKASEMEFGGNVKYAIGNNGYSKLGMGLSSGLLKNNWAYSFSAVRMNGDGYVKNTQFSGFSYFLNISKQEGNHLFNFNALGARQKHGQRLSKLPMNDYLKSPEGVRYNPDWGIKNGEIIQIRDNFYHKPLLTLNHYWSISDKSNLSTSLYTTFGQGGGGGTGGDFYYYRTDDAYGPVDLDSLVADNQTSADGSAMFYLKDSGNKHYWHGLISVFETDWRNDLSFTGGVDLRYFKGTSFSVLTDLLGADYLLDNNNLNAPNRQVKEGEMYSYHYEGFVNWEGTYMQLEYDNDKINAMFNISGSRVSHKRLDFYRYLDTDPNRESNWITFFASHIKTGLNYNLNKTSSVYGNAALLKKPPEVNAIFQNFRNDINPDAVNQKIKLAEIGYRFKGNNFNTNLNFYYSLWKDRTLTKSFQDIDGTPLFANILGVNALHKGLELDLNYSLSHNLAVYGMLSLGKWEWINNVTEVNYYDSERNLVGVVDMFIEDLRVGNAAQTTFALGGEYEINKQLTFAVDYNYFADHYADFDPVKRTDSKDLHVNSWKLPSYGLMDLNLSYEMFLGNMHTALYLNVYNVFDTVYISDALDGLSHDAAGARVFYGYGRTWNLGLNLKF